jgi:hypothetical protein
MALTKWSVSDIQECIEKMTSKEVKYDCVLAISGKRGTGKSTLGYKILAGLKIEKRFDPRRDIVYSREETIKHFANKINGCIMADEMINVMYKRDFYQEDQKELLKAVDMYRDSRNVLVTILPLFSDLDIKFQKVVKLRIDVVRRGVALLHTQVPSIYNPDVWDIKNNMKLESKWALKGTKNPKYGQLTTCRGIIRFGDLSPVQRDLYDKIKFEKRGHVFAKYQNNELMKSPEELFISNIITELKAGNINPKSFELMCKLNSKTSVNIRHQINKKLKAENDNKSFKDYCITEEKKRKLDLLGFEQKAAEKIIKPIAPVIPNETPVKSDNIEDNEDILGFES